MRAITMPWSDEKDLQSRASNLDLHTIGYKDVDQDTNRNSSQDCVVANVVAKRLTKARSIARNQEQSPTSSKTPQMPSNPSPREERSRIARTLPSKRPSTVRQVPCSRDPLPSLGRCQKGKWQCQRSRRNYGHDIGEEGKQGGKEDRGVDDLRRILEIMKKYG